MSSHARRKSNAKRNANVPRSKGTFKIKRKRNAGRIIWAIVILLLFAIFATATYYSFAYDFQSNKELNDAITSKLQEWKLGFIAEDYGVNGLFRCFFPLLFLITWNMVGVMASKYSYFFRIRNEALEITISVILFLIYIAGILAALHYISNWEIEQFFQGDAETWSNSFFGQVIGIACVMELVAVVLFVVMRLMGSGIWLHVVAYVLIPPLFLLVIAFIVWGIIGMVADKIPISTSGGSSSSSSGNTYTFTNDMGCTTTVVSDNGRDFYDPNTGSYVGSSDDNGETITVD